MLTETQREAAVRIAAEEGGGWARARLDRTAEVFTRSGRGAVTRFALDEAGRTIGRAVLPPTQRFLRGRRLMALALGAAALSAAELGWRELAGDAVGPLWLVPVASVAAAFLVAAYSLGMASRVPPAAWDAGPWAAFPGSDPGDVSSESLVRTAIDYWPLTLLYLLFFSALGAALGAQEVGGGSGGWIGLGGGLFAWWAMMLAFSRGWIVDGD